jgi:hypothetical protein
MFKLMVKGLALTAKVASSIVFLNQAALIGFVNYLKCRETNVWKSQVYIYAFHP